MVIVPDRDMVVVQECKHGVRVGSPFHDCAYVDFRERLVPLAEAYADEKAGPRPPTKCGESGSMGKNPQYDEWTRMWNLLFHDYITQQVREHFGI